MQPILVELGPLVIATGSLFSLLAFLTTAFVFWRKTREEHYQQEQAFDAFLLSAIFGLVLGRVGFILLNWAEFSQAWWHSLDIVGHPGSSIFIGLFGATWFLHRYAGRQKWDRFEILDFWFLAVTAGMILKQIGNFFAGVGFGYETNLPWGVIFPSVFVKHHPTQIYSALFFLLLYLYLYWAEYNYRTFTWYRASKKAAQTGFLTAMTMIWSGLFLSLMLLVKPAQLTVGNLSIDLIFYVVLSLSGLVLLWNKSGRSFGRS